MGDMIKAACFLGFCVFVYNVHEGAKPMREQLKQENACFDKARGNAQETNKCFELMRLNNRK